MSNNKISVTVKFFATLRKYGPEKEVLTIPENSKVKIFFDKFNVPQEERNTIILVNGRPHKDINTALNDGDLISIFPQIGGG